MSSFDLLHPALQHHVVNSLGWRELRAFQEDVIPPILEGRHMIIVAPTAGGKTEAAVFPVFSRMLEEGWDGLSVLYVCPIKALLNNLDVRLQRYAGLLGRKAALWHGDVTAGARRRILRDQPDLLLTTPESLEAMLVSSKEDCRRLLAGLRVVIVDEIHAFAGDDRGWHLQCVLERVTKIAGRELQRLGLSATVGNPETLLDWLAGHCAGARSAYLPPATAAGDADVQLDYVGSLENATTIVSRLHRGEKRLVFVDSRSRAEQLAVELRSLGIDTFVSHSSLSADERRCAEEAFASRQNCVIVATSALELGIDVGDLDRVIQIDSPPTVSGFLQRMGRTGRRAGTVRNCLFLATREDALLQAAGIIGLWQDGFVEPVVPPPHPYHVLAQQVMALALQEGGIGRRTWATDWLGRVPVVGELPDEKLQALISWMLEQGILWDDDGVLWFAEKGEKVYGRKNFLELLSVFTSAPLYSVLCGQQELGFVDELTFAQRVEGSAVLSLGGRSWRVVHLDRSKRIAYVEPTEDRGRSRWRGAGQGLGYDLCQAMKGVLVQEGFPPCWSARARAKLEEMRADHKWLDPDATSILVGEDGEETDWWTFAGSKANFTLRNALLSQHPDWCIDLDSLKIKIRQRVGETEFLHAIEAANLRDSLLTQTSAIDDTQLHCLKFSDAVPPSLLHEEMAARLGDAMKALSIQGTRRVIARSYLD